MRGCDSVQQVAPQLWKDRNTIEEAAAARLRSRNPCPDEMLAERVRTLLDLKVVFGQRFLYFTGANFQTCQIVPATPSAEAAVRNASPAPRRAEDAAPIGARM